MFRPRKAAMRLRKFPTLAATIFTSLLVLTSSAQSPPAHDPDALDTTTTDARSPAPPMTPEEVALIDRYLTAVRAQPVGKIDTKNAAPGQGITFQVAEGATLANGTELPKGTRLTGRILRAQAYEKDASAAVLSIQIDRAILSGGNSIPIRCVLRAIAPAAGSGANLPDASQSGSRRRNNSSSIGGPVGGAVPLGDPTPMGGPIGADSGDIGNSPSNGSAYPGTSGNPTSTRGVVNGGGMPTGDPGIGGSGARVPLPNTAAIPASADPEQPVVSAGDTIRDTPHRTGLPGVMLSGASVAGVSGTLSALDHNITLNSGSQLTFGIITR